MAMRTVNVLVESVEHETDLALLFVVDGRPVWVPRTCVPDADEIEVGDEEIEVAVAAWFAAREGLV